MLSYAIKKTDKNGCVHSVDNLIIEFIVKNYDHKRIMDMLADLFEKTVDGWEREKNERFDSPASSRFAWFRSAVWCDGFYIQVGQFGEYDKETKRFWEIPLLRIKFNPNKYLESPFFDAFLGWSLEWCECGHIVKFDYCIDVPVVPASLLINSKKDYGVFKGTRYYGQRNKHGHLKIYDKAKESGLESPLTRCEWTFQENKEIAFDDITWIIEPPKAEYDGLEIGPKSMGYVKLIAMIRNLGGDVQEALSFLDRRTQKKIEPYTVGSGIKLLSHDTQYLEWVLQYYCDVLSVSYSGQNVKCFVENAEDMVL